MAKGDVRRRRLEELGPLSEENAILIDSWVRSMRTRKLAKNTISSYQGDLEQLARSYAHNRSGAGPGETPLNRIEGPGLADWLNDMADGDVDEAEWSSSTINRKVAALRQFYEWLIVIRGEEIPNPTMHLIGAKREKHLPKFLEAEDLRAIFELLRARSDGQAEALPEGAEDVETEKLLATIDMLVAGMCYYWGLRISEAVGLLWDDVRIEATGDFNAVVRRKGGKVRVCPSQPQLVPFVHRYLALRPSIDVRAAAHREYFFLNPRTGRPLTRQTAFQRIRSAAVAALGEKGERVSPHWLRHSLARHLLDEGHDIRRVQEALDHERLDTTAIYLGAREGEVEEVLRSRDIEDAIRARRRQLDKGA